MAKKRKSRKSRQVAMPRSIPVPVSARTGASASARPSSAEAVAEPTVSFAEEYRYVITDLKRIGILAAAMFGLLVVLALILR